MKIKMKVKSKKHLKGGFALVTLIFFMLIVTIVMSAAVAVLVINSETSGKVQLSTVAATIAESGAENAVLRLLRDPQYLGEASLPVGPGNATIVVPAGPFPKIITSTGIYNNFRRTTSATVNYDVNNRLVISNWGESN